MKAHVQMALDLIDPPEGLGPDEIADLIQGQLTSEFDNLPYGIDDLKIAITDNAGRELAKSGFGPPRSGGLIIT